MWGFAASFCWGGGEGVSEKAYTLFAIHGFPVTNGMLYSWIVSLFLVLVVRWAVGKPSLVPSRGQVVVETLIENLREMIGPIVGQRVKNVALPLLVAFFSYILIQNWSSLIPGVGTVGTYDEGGHFLYFFRPATADLNATLGLAIVSFGAWLYFIFRYAGVKKVIWHIFGNKADRREVPTWVYSFLFVVFLAVGFVECVSILFRLVSLSFRLFGNIFGGENLLTYISQLSWWSKYLLPVPFYFLEILVGLIQALVFTLLVAVYIGLICNHDEAH
jgi:F-type H+-transporting ATPase subunit a